MTRRRECAEVQECSPPGKELRVTPCHADEDEIKQNHQPSVVLAQRRFADEIVDHPAAKDRSKRNRDGDRA